jgi:hypothetical protein
LLRRARPRVRVFAATVRRGGARQRAQGHKERGLLTKKEACASRDRRAARAAVRREAARRGACRPGEARGGATRALPCSGGGGGGLARPHAVVAAHPQASCAASACALRLRVRRRAAPRATGWRRQARKGRTECAGGEKLRPAWRGVWAVACISDTAQRQRGITCMWADLPQICTYWGHWTWTGSLRRRRRTGPAPCPATPL